MIGDYAAGDTIIFLANEDMTGRYTVTEVGDDVVIAYGQSSSVTVLNATESDLSINFVSELDAQWF